MQPNQSFGVECSLAGDGGSITRPAMSDRFFEGASKASPSKILLKVLSKKSFGWPASSCRPLKSLRAVRATALSYLSNGADGVSSKKPRSKLLTEFWSDSGLFYLVITDSVQIDFSVMTANLTADVKFSVFPNHVKTVRGLRNFRCRTNRCKFPVQIL